MLSSIGLRIFNIENMNVFKMNRILFLVLLVGLCFPATSFEMTSGTTSKDVGEAVIQTSDGGYAIVGNEGYDAVLMKVDNFGNQSWTQTYDGFSSTDYAYDVKQTSDGDYIIVGSTRSGGNFNGIYGYVVWMIKTDSDGNELWARPFLTDEAGKGNAVAVDITSDGSYILFATSESSGDTYVIKTDASGNELFRYIHYDLSVQSGLATSDGGYIFAALTPSLGARVIRADNNGSDIWSNEYDNNLYSIEKTSDGGYIAAGSKDGDFWLIKLDSSGNEDFNNLYDDDGSSWSHAAFSVDQANDGGYIAAGYKNSFSGQDIWLLKVDVDGGVELNNTYPVSNSDEDWAYSVKSANDGGYILTGYTKSSGAGNKDIYILKTDENLDLIPCDGSYDCNYVCDGGAVLDDCDVCDGGNADMDCAGVCGGTSVLDCTDVCNGDAEMDNCMFLDTDS